MTSSVIVFELVNGIAVFFFSVNQGGKRPGGETGSPLLVRCVMRRRTGASVPSALRVQ